MDDMMEVLKTFLAEQQKKEVALDLRLRNIEYMLEQILEQVKSKKKK
jgi:hypothetical protein